MKIYNQQKDGSFVIDNMTIPDNMNNRHRRQLQDELDAVPPLATVNPYVPPALPAVDDIPLSAEDRLALLAAENPVPPAKVSAYKQGKRDRGEA